MHSQYDRPVGTKSFRRMRWIVVSLCILLVGTAPALGAAADDEAPPVTAPSDATAEFFSPEDGWLDFGTFIDKSYGFVPIAGPVTEPAVGYGAWGGLTFIDKPFGEAKDGYGKPNITAVGGLITENGTSGAVIGDVRYWLDDRLQTVVGGAKASVNLDFFGFGEDSVLEDHPIAYNLGLLGGIAQAKYRIRGSRFWTGLRYELFATEVEFDAPSTAPGLPDFRSEYRVGGLTPMLSYDSRDNMFTPLRGTYAEATAGFYGPALGGEDEFQYVYLNAIQFFPLHSKLTLGVQGSATMSFGEMPFFLRPFIILRGAPVMRYLGEHVAQVETELRWQFWKRFSLVGFAGVGATYSDVERLDTDQRITTGGGGFRYEVARDYKLHMGIDLAFGPDTVAIYVVFGSAWLRL